MRADPEATKLYNRAYKRKQREAAAQNGKCRTCCKALAETPGGYCKPCAKGTTKQTQTEIDRPTQKA